MSLLIVTHCPDCRRHESNQISDVDPRVSRTRFPVHCVANEDSSTREGVKVCLIHEGTVVSRVPGGERGRGKNRNPSKEDLPPVKLDVRRLNSSRSSVYRRSTPTWQEAIQCKSRADTSGPRVAARLRSGTSLIRVRAFVHSASWMQHRWKTGVSFPSSFLPLPTPRRLRSFQPWTTNTRNYSYSFHSGSSVCVSVCKFGFVAVATWAD